MEPVDRSIPDTQARCGGLSIHPAMVISGGVPLCRVEPLKQAGSAAQGDAPGTAVVLPALVSVASWRPWSF